MASFSEQIQEFTRTAAGKVLVVAVPTVLLGIVITFGALTYLRGGASSEVETVSESAKQDGRETDGDTQTNENDGPDKSETAESSGTVEAIESGETTESTETFINEDYEVYDTRDPFLPSDSTLTMNLSVVPIDPLDPATPETSETLSLEAIEANAGGTLFATVEHDGKTHIVQEGDRVGDSAYKVIAISDDSATFLFGDDTIVLKVGEATGK